MRRFWSVAVVLLVATLLGAADAAAQQRTGDPPRKSRLGQNYPNPFNPTTKIPFALLESDFVEGKPAVVTIRILTILMELVAYPQALSHPEGNATVDRLEYTMPGTYEAYWDGTDRTGRKVASGPYLLELTVNGERQTRTMVVAK